MKILLVEDDADIAASLVELLQENYQVDWAISLHDAQTLYLITHYDCIVADFYLPDGTGMDLCHTVRLDGSNVPFLIITANTLENQKVQSLLHGADDYLIKPFLYSEFSARIRAMLRRCQQAYTPNTLQINDLYINQLSCRVQIGCQTLDLTRKEYDLLVYLAHHLGQPVPATTLIESIWDSNKEPFSNTIEVHICHLRHKIAKYTKSVSVKTRKNYGYVLTAQ